METEPSIPGVIRFLSFQIFLCNVAENSKSPVRGCQGKPCHGSVIVPLVRILEGPAVFKIAPAYGITIHIETQSKPRGRIIAASPDCEFASKLALEKLNENHFTGFTINCRVMDLRNCIRRANAGRTGTSPHGANSTGTTTGSAIGSSFFGF